MNDVTRCPFCAEEILAAAVKCKHCGSEITIGSYRLDQKASDAPRPLVRGPFAVLGIIALLIVGGGVAYSWYQTGTMTGRGFTDSDVSRLEQDIRTEYQKRGVVKVTEVKLIKESPTKLTGFAKVKVPLIGEIDKPCSVTMGEDGQVMWQCQ